MNLQQRVKIAAQALTGKTENSLGVSEANKFLRYGSGTQPLIQNWSEVKMSDEDMYTGYSYAAIVKRANRTSVVGRRFILTEANRKYTENFTGDPEELIHPYLKVINRSKDFTKKQFWYEISTYLDLEGVYYLGTVRNSRTNTNGETTVGAVQKFVLINPYEVRKVVNEATGEVGGYVESHNGFYREWAPEQIIEMRMLNPFNKDKAFAMTDAAKESQFTMKQAGDYTRQTINGNIASPGIVTTNVELDEQQFANFKSRVTNRQKGEPIFGNGAGSLNWQDMQIDLDKAALDKVNEIQRAILFAVSSTSKTVLGIEESGTTRDTSETQDENFTIDAIVPRVEDISDFLNLDYRKWYSEWEENEFEITVDNPLGSDKDGEIKDIEIRDAAFDLAQKLISKGYDREEAFKYAYGEITWDALSEPKEPEIPPQLQPTNPQNPTTPAEETSITQDDEATNQPEQQTSPSTPSGTAQQSISWNLTEIDTVQNQISSRDYPDLYSDMDIDVDDLGCIMLDLEPMEVLSHMPQSSENDLFENPKWDQGSVPAETVPHVTLLYGLLENGNKWKNKVDQLLDGWNLDSVKIDHVDFFDTPDSYAVIAHLEKTPELVDGHERLTLLPHINTFSEYLPHMTLAYVKKEADVNVWVDTLNKVYAGKTVDAAGINYGDEDDDSADNSMMGKKKKKKRMMDKDSDDKVADDALGHALSSIGQEHNSVSPAGLIVAYNDLDGSARDIVKSQENKLKDGVANIERQIIESSVGKVTKNFLDTDSDVVSESEQNKFEKEMMALLIVFYTNLFPIYGRQLMSQRSHEYGVVVPYEVTKEAQNYIEQMAKQASISHVNTVVGDILKAAQAAYYEVTIDNLVEKLQQELAAGNENIKRMLPSNPTTEQIRQAAESGKFTDMSIYEEAQRVARQGAGRDEIARAIRKKYQDISKNRATTIARTESARVFNQSQFEADKQFLTNAGLMKNAYKKLRSRTGTPCEHCQMLINQPPIPFMQNFANLGTILKATETSEDGTVKVKTLPINYEAVSAGNVHPNCNCEYVLIIKD